MVLSQGVGSCLHCSKVLLPDLLSVQVFVTLVPVTEKTRGYSEGVTPWMSLHCGVRSEDLAMALPVHPGTHPSILLQNYVPFFVPVPTGISWVFPLLAIHGVFLSPSSQVSLGRGGRLWILPTALEPGGLQLLPHFMKGFLLHFRCQIRLGNSGNVKVLNIPVPFLLKSSKPVIILKLKCWWRNELKLCQECSPVAP